MRRGRSAGRACSPRRSTAGMAPARASSRRLRRGRIIAMGRAAVVDTGCSPVSRRCSPLQYWRSLRGRMWMAAHSRHGLCRPRRERLPAWLPWRRRCRRSRRMRRTPRQRESSILRRGRAASAQTRPDRGAASPPAEAAPPPQAGASAAQQHAPLRASHGPRRCGIARRPQPTAGRTKSYGPGSGGPDVRAGGADAGRAILGPMPNRPASAR